jgi:hypothetical protein
MSKPTIMFYSSPAKGEDGLYFVKASNDDKTKCLVQLNDVTVSEVSGELVFDVASEEKITEVESMNLVAAQDNCEEWFGKKLSKAVLASAYQSVLSSGQMSADIITEPKVLVFNKNQEPLDFEIVQPGKKCDLLLEFAGIWFAKKAFGGNWNVVQIRVHEDPVVEDPISDVYPEQYAFVDEVETEQ